MNRFVLLVFTVFCSSLVDCRTGPAPCNVIHRHNKTKLVDLNVDCLLLIFDDLSLDELLSMTEANKEFAPIAADIYRRRHSSTHVRIIPPFSSVPIENYRIELLYEGISIRHFVAASRYLKIFGHLIPSLELIYNFDPATGSEAIDKLISLHCSETLTSLIVYVDKNGFFDDFTRPFKKVESVQLIGTFTSLDNSILRFDELFPAMRKLYFGEVYVRNSSAINHKFSNLEDFSVYFSAHDGSYFNETDIERLIKKNPQIRKLNLMNASRKLLKIAAEHLPQLEDLKLLWYAEQSDDGDEIHFENLKTFAMIDGSHTMPSHVSFGKLEEFLTKAPPKTDTRWLDFVANETNLKKVQVVAKLNDREVEHLATHHLKLTDISIKCDKKVKDETIVELVKNSENLKKLKLVRDTYRDGTPKSKSLKRTKEVLRMNFGEQWDINESWLEIDMQRKK